MVYRRRKRPRKKRTYRKRPYRKRKTRISRFGIGGTPGVHMVRQKVYSTFTIPNTATAPGPFFVRRSFNLGELPQALSFRQLYDQYRINAVNTKILLNSNTDPTTNQNLQLGYVLNERDDAATPIDWTQFMERAAVRIKNLYPSGNGACQASMYVKPTPLTQIYESVAGTGYAVMRKAPWIDMGDPLVPHYGLLYGFNNGQETRNNEIKVTLITTYYMAFKGLQ